MIRTALAFVWDEATVEWAIRKALGAHVDRLVIVSENDVSTLDGSMDMSVEKRHLSEFRPLDLDETVTRNIREYYLAWLSENPGFDFHLKNSEIDYPVYSSFSSIIFRHFRRIVLMDRVLREIRPEVVITDSSWRKHLILDVGKSDVILISNDNEQSQVTHRRGFRLAALTFIGALGGIVAPILLGKIVNLLSGRHSITCSCLLIGDTGTNKSFAPVWDRISGSVNVKEELSQGNTSMLEVFADVRAQRRWVDGYCTWAAMGNQLFEYIKIVRHYLAARNKCYPLPNYSLYQEPTIQSAPDVVTDLDWFFLKSLSRAICSKGVGKCFKRMPWVKTVIFTRLSPAIYSLSHQLRKIGIKTVSTTHGMVLDPIGYKARDCIKLTWGEFDARLLQRFSDDDKYIGLPVNPEGFKGSPETTSDSCFNSESEIRGVFPCRNSDMDYCDLKGKSAIVFPSTYQHGENLIHFITLTVSHLLRNRAKYGFDYIIVKPKKHPRTNYKEYYTALSRIGPSDSPIPIILSDSGNISSLLNRCSFCLCTLSSIVLDCIRMRVPFSVYLGDSLSDRSFISMLPAWMRFYKEEDLSSIKIADLQQFNTAADMLQSTYWGNSADQFQMLQKEIFWA